ncbi:DNA polymerase V [Kushneria avicenniae]|uniref:DNA polymerase V n=1 Tax=Kushneria avicenniae TaxID=402385 RepID=A0A1I1LFJ9_9GAMM|nr:translesion error-prone DNA polymerase V autoproteolytic subunit [Kushneria avicenniae]SFC71809.1 DNA polymerase V [Kushneria avicenniae]
MLHVTSPQALTVDPTPRSIPWATCHVRAGISGFPSPAQDYDGGRIDLNEALIPRPTSTFMFTAEGDSMQAPDGAGIHGGDKLLVDRAIEARHGDIVVAVVDGELLVKELRHQDCPPALHSANPRHAPIPMHSADCQIWGVVTHIVRTVRR